LAGLLGESGMVGLEETAFARQGFDEALGFKLGVGSGDGVAVDAQFLGERAEGGERIAGAQAPGSGGVADLVGQLQIDRLARLEINLKDHNVSTVTQHYDS